MTNLKKRILTSLIILPLSIFFILKGGYFLLFFLLSIFFVTNYELFSVFNKKTTILFLDLILILSLYSIYYLVDHAVSFYLLLWVIILVICSDVGGYVFGKIFKWKKLTKISPNKTISGSIGSFCFSILPLLLFYNLDQSKYSYSINNFLLCLEISLVCQLGDIFISYLKRKAKVKDTGRILPGHGGILDRIDGIIFAIPFAYIYHIGLTDYFEIWIEIISNAFKNL